MSKCRDCDGTGAFSYPCRYCEGSGKIEKRDMAVDCGYCFGSGMFYPQFKQKKGTKIKTFSLPFVVLKLGNGKSIFAYKCKACRGTGEHKSNNSQGKRNRDAS